jgi:hypothetical protein
MAQNPKRTNEDCVFGGLRKVKYTTTTPDYMTIVITVETRGKSNIIGDDYCHGYAINDNQEAVCKLLDEAKEDIMETMKLRPGQPNLAMRQKHREFLEELRNK